MYYLYFIQKKGKGNQPVKIGYSKDPDSRCLNLQTGCPDKLIVRIRLPFSTEKEARTAEKPSII